MSDASRFAASQTFGEREIEGLSDVLIDCVEGGASVSFMLPMTRAKAEAFWRGAAASVARGERVVLAAEDAAGRSSERCRSCWRSPRTSRIAATSRRCSCTGARAGAASARRCSPPPSAARSSAGKTLLVLDTASGDAERLYARQGWQRCGRDPGLRADARRRALRDHDLLQVPARCSVRGVDVREAVPLLASDQERLPGT